MTITKIKKDMEGKINYSIADIGTAFLEALEYCRIYGLDWKEHVKPMIKNKQLKGYYVIDETGSTTVARIEI